MMILLVSLTILFDCIYYIKLRFQEWSQSLNPTKQPLTVPERLKKGRYFVLIVGVMDAEEQGDQNALGLSLIRQVEEKICTINCY